MDGIKNVRRPQVSAGTRVSDLHVVVTAIAVARASIRTLGGGGGHEEGHHYTAESNALHSLCRQVSLSGSNQSCALL